VFFYVDIVPLRYNNIYVVFFSRVFYSQVEFMGVLASEHELFYVSALIAANLSVSVDFGSGACVK
jgi:hypothetical protein